MEMSLSLIMKITVFAKSHLLVLSVLLLEVALLDFLMVKGPMRVLMLLQVLRLMALESSLLQIL